MIFKTFNSDIDKLTSKIGIFGKSFNAIFEAKNQRKIDIDDLIVYKDMSLDEAKKQVGNFWSYLYPKKEDIQKQLIDVDKLLPEIDDNKASKILEFIKSIENGTNKEVKSFQELYDTGNKTKQWIAEYGQSTKDQIRSTEGVIKANQQARASALAHNEAIKAQTFSAKAGKVVLQALATAGNMLVMWGVTEVITLFHDLATASDRLQESAEELGSTLSSTRSDFEDYQSRINELQDIIKNDSSSYQETYAARKQLLGIQDELIEKYGNEAETIRLVTEAINGNNDALNELSQNKAKEILENFNKGTGKKWTERFADSMANFFSGSKKNVDRMVNQMENTNISFRIEPVYDQDLNKVYADFQKKAKEIFDVQVESTDIGNTFTVSGDLDEIYNKLKNIKSLAKDMGIEDSSFFTDLDKQIDKAKDSLDSYSEAYNQYILSTKIFENDDYTDTFNKIREEYKKYQEAFASGNEESIEKAKQSFAEVVHSATEGITDESVVDFFEQMYPDLQAVVAGWEFGFHFKAAIEDDKDNFENDVKENISAFRTSDDIRNYNEKTASDEQITAYYALIDLANEYGTDLDNLITKLEQLGLIAPQVDADIRNSIRSISDNRGISDRNQYEQLIAYTANFTEEEKKLWLESTKSAENATEAIEMYEAALAKAQQTANEAGISLSISQTIDHLNTQLKPAFDALKSAYQDIFTDDKFELNSIDILSTCDSIKSKLNEMSESGLNVDYSSFEDFVRVLNNTESTEQDVETAFDSLSASITQAALTGAEDFDTMKAALEDLGVVNSEMVAFDALASNAEMLEQALAQTNVSMDDFIINAEADSVEATKAGQAFLEEKVGAENCAEALNILAFHKQLCNLQKMNTVDEVSNLKTLAENAGYTAEVIQYLTELEQIYQEIASGTLTKEQILIKTGRAAVLKTLIDSAASNIHYEPKVDWSGDVKVAKSAGGTAGDAYVEAFDEELKSLQELRDRGVIDESDYLQRLRALYTRYFADRKEYINQYNEYERQYLDGMKSLYDSALSGVSKLMSHQIDGYTEAKEAAVASLEAEKEARLEAIEAQKEQLEAEQDLIDERIDAKQELIDGIQKEIDAMKDARAERQRQLDLQKAQYELESMKNQRTILLYSREKGMHYVADDSAVRDAQEKVDDAKFDIEVSQKEKEIKLIEQEIDLLEEQKEAIQEQIDALDGQAERIEEYYSKMISETEKYYDSLISNTEKQKAKWEELAEVEEIAQAYSAMKQVFGDMGYTVQDILNGNEQAFEDFKSKYVSLLSDMNNNANFAEGLSYATGISEENLGSFLDKTKDAGAGIDELSSKSSSLGVVAEGMDGIANSASNANTQILDTAANVGNVVANVGELSTHLGTVNTLVSDEQAAFDSLRQTIANVIDAIDQKTQAMLNEQVVTGIAVTTEIAYFTLLKEKILELQECISNINLAVMTLDRTPIDNLADAFRCLYDQILLVSTTLGIGGKDQGTSALGSITSALQALNEISLEKGIITQLANLQTAIIGVASAISGGGGGEAPDVKGYGKSASLPEGKADGKVAGKGGSNSLTGAITQMGTTASKVIGKPEAEGDGTVIGEFGSMKTAVTDVTTSIGNGDSEGTEEQNNDSADEGDGTLIDSIVSLGNTTKEVLGEPGGEGVIGRFEQFKQPISEADDHVQSIVRGLKDIDGQNVECTIKIHVESDGPLPGGGILKSTMNTESGEYTADYGSTHPTKQTTNTITTSSGLKLQPIRPGDSAWALQEAFAPLLREMNHHLAASAMYEQRRQTEQMIRDITAANMIYNNKNVQPAIHGGVHITCPGVTSQEVARQVGAELNHMFNGLHNYADQQSSVR